MQDREKLYQKAGDLHGSICGGVVLGVRMALLGCRMIDLNEPQRFENRKKLMVLVETDRCATDGIQTVTGCTLGKRTLRVMDYGIMAATFINLETMKAVRVSMHSGSRERAKALFPEMKDKKRLYVEAYKTLPDRDLFKAEEVKVKAPEVEFPGSSAQKRSLCELCGEEILGGRAIPREGKLLCRRCACLPLYYDAAGEISLLE